MDPRTTGRYIVPTKVFVQSEQRDRVLFPEAQKYDANFPDEYHNVVAVTAVEAVVPRTMRAVNQYNKYVDFSVGGTEYNVTLTETESITAAGLATDIQAKMNAAGAAVTTFVVTVDSDTSQMTITNGASSTAFNMLFSSGTNAENSAAALMGFKREDFTGLQETTGDFRVHVDPQPFVDVKVDHDSRTSHIARVALTSDWNHWQSQGVSQVFHVPKLSLDKLGIRWTFPHWDRTKPDRDYLFNGTDHSLILEVSQLRLREPGLESFIIDSN